MKIIGVAIAAYWVTTLGAVANAAGELPALAPFYRFADAINAGDSAKAAALYASPSPIIDEFGPHVWKSFAEWNQDFLAFLKSAGASDFHMAVAAPTFKSIDAAHAYGVAPTTLSFKAKGKPMTEKGMFTFSTVKTADGWRITGWAWSTL